MKTDKNTDIALVNILSDIAMILDTSMVIRSTYGDDNLANYLVEFVQELSKRTTIAGELKHD